MWVSKANVFSYHRGGSNVGGWVRMGQKIPELSHNLDCILSMVLRTTYMV